MKKYKTLTWETINKRNDTLNVSSLCEVENSLNRNFCSSNQKPERHEVLSIFQGQNVNFPLTFFSLVKPLKTQLLLASRALQ